MKRTNSLLSLVKRSLQIFPLLLLSMLAFVVQLRGTAPSISDWILSTDVDGVRLYYKLDICDSRNVMFLKLENSTSVDVKVDVHVIVENSVPMPQIISLRANETLTGQCMGTPDLVKDIKGASTPPPQVSLKVIN